MGARSELLRDLRKSVLRNRKQHGYRLQLGNRHYPGSVGGVYDVSRVNNAQARDTRNRGRNLGISQLKLGILDIGQILLDGAFILRHQRCLRIRLLTWNYSFLQQFLVTPKIYLRVAQKSLVVRQSSLSQTLSPKGRGSNSARTCLA